MSSQNSAPKIILVTGGSRGLGRKAVAVRLIPLTSVLSTPSPPLCAANWAGSDTKHT
jgi:hypothetical protein